jgi:hypothetical protein
VNEHTKVTVWSELTRECVVEVFRGVVVDSDGEKVAKIAAVNARWLHTLLERCFGELDWDLVTGEQARKECFFGLRIFERLEDRERFELHERARVQRELARGTQCEFAEQRIDSQLRRCDDVTEHDFAEAFVETHILGFGVVRAVCDLVAVEEALGGVCRYETVLTVWVSREAEPAGVEADDAGVPLRCLVRLG